ncbi:MAG: hypothetical protein JWN51_3112 [Phycisphaerales bacterium]|nr:hypothetical protein [Phycisphaerales bacterium]
MSRDTNRASGILILLCFVVGLIAGCENPNRRVVRERVVVHESAAPAQGSGMTTTGPTTSVAPVSTGPVNRVEIEEDAEYFYDDLVPYGQWIDVPDYGPCWQPYNVPPDWRPYTVGYWSYTDDVGWLWVSDEPFGWCCFHYGRWAFVTGFGWCWVPGREWAGAWVVWRYGGGYVGWAPLPPARRGWAEVVEIVDPPFWAFIFVEERYVGDRRLREHIEPVTRNVTLINVTKNVTRYEVVNGRYVNHGVDVRTIERRIGRPIPRVRVTDVASPRQVGVRGDEVMIHRPQIPARRPAAERAAPRFVQENRPVPTAAELEARRRAIDAYHQTLLAQMREQQLRELQQVPSGPAREQLLAHQQLERQAFDLQRRNEIQAVPVHPVPVHPMVMRRR